MAATNKSKAAKAAAAAASSPESAGNPPKPTGKVPNDNAPLGEWSKYAANHKTAAMKKLIGAAADQCNDKDGNFQVNNLAQVLSGLVMAGKISIDDLKN